MPASPLTAALMGGNPETSAIYGMTDPALLQAMPDLQISQSLLQSGLSTEPASPAQAIGRLAQTLAGQYIRSGAISDLSKGYSNSAESMAQVFDQTAGPGNIVSRMLRSGNPLVVQQGLQLAQKAGLQVNEQNPTLAGGVAGAKAAAEAPYKPAGTVTVNGPNGPTQTPITASTLAGMQPGAPPRTASSPTPSAAIPPPQGKPLGSIIPGPGAPQIMGGGAEPPATFDQRFNPQLASEGEIASAQTTGQENAKNVAELGDLLKPQGPIQPGPGTTEPVKTPSGTTIPPLKEQTMPTSPAELKTAVGAWQKTQDEWQTAVQPAYKAQIQLSAIANAFKQFQTGSWEANKAQVAAGLKAVGIPDSVVQAVAGGDPAQVQIALHSNYVETLNQLKASTPRFTQMEFRALSENKEHPNLQPEANLEMLSQDIGTLKQAIDLPSDFTAARQYGWKNPQAFEQAWLKQNPLSDYVARAKQEIGPLKGMAGAQGGAAPATRPVPNAGSIAALKADPSKRDQFDAFYGPGMAAQVLGK